MQKRGTVRYLTHNKQWDKGVIISMNQQNKRDYTIQNKVGKIVRRKRAYLFRTHAPTTCQTKQTVTDENIRMSTHTTVRPYITAGKSKQFIHYIHNYLYSNTIDRLDAKVDRPTITI